MFRVKICGITNTDDARLALAAGADAIGLNFFPDSPRCVERSAACGIVEVVRDQLMVVGVFVNCPPDRILEIADQVPLDVIQLHGDEPPAVLSQLKALPVIRALRLGDDSQTAVVEYLEASRQLGAPVSGMLVDAFEKGSYGGTGKLANWEKARNLSDLIAPCPLLLAGGLNPTNVAEAIRSVGCHGVDVASGVELQPGKKDAVKTREFVAAGRQALGL